MKTLTSVFLTGGVLAAFTVGMVHGQEFRRGMFPGGPGGPGGPRFMQGGPGMAPGMAPGMGPGMGRGGRGGPGGGGGFRGRGGPPFGGSSGRGGPFSRGGPRFSGDRASRLEGFLRSIDANRNGVLEPGEIPEERRRMFTFLAGRAGLDPNKPIPISTIREKMAGGASSGGGSEKDSKSEKSKKGDSKKEEAEPLVPGFGVPEEVVPVPGFGERVELTSAMPMRSRQSGDRKERSRGDRDKGDRDERFRRFAQYMLRRYDRNENGKLEKDEWGPLKGRGRDPESYDQNHDGVITLDEMTSRMAESSGRGRGSDSEPSEASSAVASRWEGRKSYRFLSPQERLPDDVPDWFVDRDANRDGQVAMAEYTSFWSDSKVREFLRYDLNRDGIITPRECLSGGIQTAGTEETAGDGQTAGEGQKAGDGQKAPAPSGSGGGKPWWM